MKEPIVTVFVTVYNVEEYLDRFFKCLLGQTMPDVCCRVLSLKTNTKKYSPLVNTFIPICADALR